MRIFLAGGTGFIGRNVLERLSESHTVVAPRRPELDMLDERSVHEYLSRESFDAVIHSAVKPGHRNAKDPRDQLFHNTRMFFNVVRNADRYGKLIFLSSGAVYDARAYQPKMKEEYFDTSVPVDEHGFSKYLISKYIHDTGSAVELRLFGVFGKYEDYAIRFISNAICKALFDLPITLKQDRRFDYLYVDDLMPVLEHFIRNEGSYSSYNVTPDESIALSELVELVRKITGKDVPVVVREEGIGPEYSGDNRRLRGELPALAFTPIEEAIGRLHDWYRTNLESIDREALLVDR